LEKLIITCALQGAETSKADNPNLPVTLPEVVKAAVDAWNAGAAICHLHVRDQMGQPTQDTETYRRHGEEIRARTDLIIQVSTGGAVGMSLEERAQPLLLNPEMASLNAGTTNFGEDVFANPFNTMRHLAREMKSRGVKPEIEVFDMSFIENALRLVKEKLLKSPLHFQFVMGVPGAMPAHPRHLLHLVETIPSESTWSVAGIGRHQLPLGGMAIILGGHVRVGFEDNIHYRRGELATSNAQLVERIVRIARELEREVASSTEAREILGLSDGHQAKSRI
jgi:3-keto-5-aminohexanoate cleavage enzyme